MSLSECPNCGEKPVFGHSRDSYYKVYLYHLNNLCPSNIEIYHHSEKECVKVWEDYIDNRGVYKA